MNDYPLVTIGVLNYNNEQFVIEALESIRSQTYKNIELIIVDDCSTDNSLNLIISWLKTYDKPFRLITHTTNQGIASTCTDIYNNASGKYLAILATDDVFLPEKTKEQVSILEAHGNSYAMVYGDVIEIDEFGNVIVDNKCTIEGWRGKDFIPPSGDIFTCIVKGLFFLTQASLINLPLLKATGFKYDGKVHAEDWDLELMVSRNYKIIGSKKVYAKYRRIEKSVSSQYMKAENIHMPYKKSIYILLKYYNHPGNTDDDKQLILNQAREIFWLLGKAQGFKRSDAIKYNFLFFKKSGLLKDFSLAMRALAVYALGLRRRQPNVSA